jgi:hypothetical protein
MLRDSVSCRFSVALVIAAAVAAVALIVSKAVILAFRLFAAVSYTIFLLWCFHMSIVVVRIIWLNCINVSKKKSFWVAFSASMLEIAVSRSSLAAVSSELLFVIILAASISMSSVGSSR